MMVSNSQTMVIEGVRILNTLGNHEELLCVQSLNLNLEENETNFKNDLANEKSAFDDEKWELNGEIDDLKDQL